MGKKLILLVFGNLQDCGFFAIINSPNLRNNHYMSQNKKRVLIVEDDQLMLNILKSKLLSEGLEISTAQDGAEGLKAVLEAKPDLIVLDIIMPRLDGISMLQALWEENPQHKDIPVIFFTNLSDASIAKDALVNIEMENYLVKTDWRPEQVVEIVKERLNS